MNILIKTLVKSTWKANFFVILFLCLIRHCKYRKQTTYVCTYLVAHAPLCWKWTGPETGNGSQACQSITLKTSVKHETCRRWWCYGNFSHIQIRKYKSMNELTKFLALFIKLNVSVIEIGSGVQTNGDVFSDYIEWPLYTDGRYNPTFNDHCDQPR